MPDPDLVELVIEKAQEAQSVSVSTNSKSKTNHSLPDLMKAADWGEERQAPAKSRRARVRFTE